MSPSNPAISWLSSLACVDGMHGAKRDLDAVPAIDRDDQQGELDLFFGREMRLQRVERTSGARVCAIKVKASVQASAARSRSL